MVRNNRGLLYFLFCFCFLEEIIEIAGVKTNNLLWLRRSIHELLFQFLNLFPKQLKLRVVSKIGEWGKKCNNLKNGEPHFHRQRRSCTVPKPLTFFDNLRCLFL